VPANRGQGQQQRQARGDERPEGEHEDQQRDRDRQDLRSLEVLVEGRRQRLVGTGAAELLDAQAGVCALGRGDGGDRRVDALRDGFVVAGDLEADDGRAAVVGDLALVAVAQRRLHVGDVAGPCEAPGDVCDGGGEARVRRAQRAPALHEHLLARLVGEARGLDRLLGGARLAVGRRGVLELALADEVAGDGRQHDEGDPAEDRLLAVAGAPATRAGSEVLTHAGLLRGGGSRHAHRLTEPKRSFDAVDRRLGGAANPTLGRRSPELGDPLTRARDELGPQPVEHG